MLRHYLRELILIALTAGCAVWLIPYYNEYRKSVRTRAEKEQEVLEQAAANAQLRNRIFDLKTNPRAIERVAREKFGYCRPNEIVYDFTPPVEPRPAPGAAAR